MFWRRNENPINSKEYEFLYKRIVELSAEVEELKNKYKILETNYDNLRGNFNRKLQGLKKEEVLEEIAEEKSINKPMLLPVNESFKLFK